ncbi:DUF2185 domain-containing protein [Paenibacillus sp. NPDC056579]|uniref:immunity protein Imm33 domain-containing protein n=1 Tax=Paenibacillus sp. NPDC056579 TaxID=3345871 RepID=UPI003674C75F
MTWKFDNVVELHKESPYTFYLPSEHVIEQLKVGDLVKLIFLSDVTLENGYEGERMWVEIIERTELDFRGKLANQPFYLKSLQYGDIVNFKSIHICNTQLDDPHSKEMDYYFDNKVTVSNDVLLKNEFNFMLRFEPDNESDLGWVFFSGYEQDDFNSDPNNFQIISVGKMLNIDDSILEFLNDNIRCAYERDTDSKKLLKIEDYDFSIHD